MKSESEPNWLLEYRKEEREAADKSNLEDRNIFLKYVEKENEMYFYDLKETEDKSNDLLRYDNETFKDKLEIKALKDLEKMPEQIYGFKDKDRV